MTSIQDKQLVLSDKEEAFIANLFSNGGNIQQAAEDADYNRHYGYILYKRLAKPIAEAAQHYLAIHSVKAAKKLVDTMDAEMPNPVQVTAAQAILNHVKQDMFKEEVKETTIKANIFILPEKRQLPIIDAEFREN